LSIGYLHAIRVLVEGISNGKPDEVVKALRKNDLVHSVFIGEGQPHFFLECIIRDIKDLDSLVEYMRKKVGIPNPNVLLDSQVKFGEKILDTRYKGPSELTRIDYQIIHALYEDARIPIGDIAEKCDASARTVKRHLDRLMENGAIDFSIDWRPGNASGLTSMLAVILEEGADQKKVRDELYEKFTGSLFVITTLSNVPGLISSYAWSPSIKRYNELLEAIKESYGIKDVQSSVLRDGWMQDTWRDKLLKENI
jgi:DNA-binding Lrp family transcriptional regulator